MTAVTPIHRSVLARPRPYSFLQLIKVHNQDSTLNTPFSDDLTSAIIAVFELLKCSSRGISDSPKLVTSMRFRSELLQRRPSDDSEATLPKIYDVYRTHDGRIEGEGDDLGDILDQQSRAVQGRY